MLGVDSVETEGTAKRRRLGAEEDAEGAGERVSESAERSEERDGGDGGGEDEDDECEGRPVRTRAVPYVPTDKDRREHNLTHYPFRAWCACCVAGRAAAGAHYRGSDKEVPMGGEFHFDYCFLCSRPTEDPATTIAGVDRSSQGVLAHVVPQKGIQFDWVAVQLAKDVRKFGYHGRLVVKSDGEPAARDLMKKLARKRGNMPTVIERSKPYD